jgi:hypothetical protein
VKKADILIGNDYAYQRDRNGERAHDIERATIVKFTDSYRGAPMVEIEVHRSRWECDYDENYTRIPNTERKVAYIDVKQVPLSTIRGDWETEYNKRVQEDKVRAENFVKAEEARKIREEFRRTNYVPAMAELLKEIMKLPKAGYVSNMDRLDSLDIETVKAITEALRKAGE